MRPDGPASASMIGFVPYIAGAWIRVISEARAHRMRRGLKGRQVSALPRPHSLAVSRSAPRARDVWASLKDGVKVAVADRERGGLGSERG